MKIFRIKYMYCPIILIAVMLFQNCGDKESNCIINPGNIVETFMDIDSNIYHGVKIGNQIWMMENLRTTRYRNGDTIPNVINNIQWVQEKNGGYCHYGNNIQNSITYGNLYNWFAVNDPRNLAPIGWHIPTNSEFFILTKYLGGFDVAVGKLKECGLDHWQSPNTGGTNETSFTALPGGLRFDGIFFDIGIHGYWWTSTEIDTSWSQDFNLYYIKTAPFGTLSTKDQGLSIRCVKD